MKKIRFITDYGKHKAGHVIGTQDGQAAQLVAQGVAVFVDNEVRPLKYTADAKTQSECVVPVIEELESAPKGATMPQSLYETPEGEAYETKDVKPGKKQKTNT